jgi:hypothetical protein
MKVGQDIGQEMIHSLRLGPNALFLKIIISEKGVPAHVLQKFFSTIQKTAGKHDMDLLPLMSQIYRGAVSPPYAIHKGVLTSVRKSNSTAVSSLIKRPLRS